MRRGLALIFVLCTGLPVVARADDVADDDPLRAWLDLEREWRRLPDLADAARVPAQGDEPRDWRIRPFDAQEHEYPRIRFEAHLRVTGGIRSRLKHGRQGFAGTFETLHDAHLPRRPTLGYRLIIDARLHDWISIGVHYTRVTVDGPRRTVHHTGIGLQAVAFGPGSRLRTTVDVQMSDLFVRLVLKDTTRIRFSIGLGAAWASHRVRLSRGDRSAEGRVETFFAPTVTYWFSVRVLEHVSFFFESTSGFVAPWRPASFVSELRIGLRFHLTERLELVTAAASSSGSIDDHHDLWGGQRTSRHLWRRAAWSALGGDVGLAFTF